MIKSKNNLQMKHLIQLQKKAKLRYDENVFVAEGMKMCLEAPRERVVSMYVSDSFLVDSNHRKMVAPYDYEVVEDSVFKGVCDTKTPQGILCIVKMPSYDLEDIINKKNAHIIVLESIQDPGNLGTIIRTGEGVGVTGIIMNQTTVDLFHPKTIRSTMGSIYRVPFFIVKELDMLLEKMKQAGITIYGTSLNSAKNYQEVNYNHSCGFLIGNEGNGLSDEMLQLADENIFIPMEGEVESLNASIAAAVLMYEVKRQRRFTSELH